MQTRIPKLLSLLLCAVMLFTVLPQAASGAEIVSSGVCGDNLTWTLDDEGTLTVRGTGAMKNYLMNSPFGGDVKKAVLEEGVTTVGNNAFYLLSGLTSVSLPETLTSIGSGAFINCRGLTAVTLPAGLQTISANAFQGCSGLTEIALPDSLTALGTGAFSGCASLAEVTLSQSLTTIGDNTFRGCPIVEISVPASVENISSSAFSECPALAAFTVDEGSNAYSSLNGVLYNKSQTALIAAPKMLAGEVTLPETLTAIGDNAFINCKALTGVTLPGTVTSIGKSAFENCVSLVDAALPAGLLSLGNNAFAGCEALTCAHIPAGVTATGSNIYRDCTALTSAVIDEGVQKLGSYAFSGCTSLTDITLPASLTSIGGNAFAKCAVETVALPATLTELGNAAFSGCAALTRIELGQGIVKIPASCFADCASLAAVTLPEGLTQILSGAFSNCASLTEITLPDTVSQIQSNVFLGCAALTSVSLPAGISEIALNAFSGCAALQTVTMTDAVTKINASAFKNCGSLAVVYYLGVREKWNAVNVTAAGNDDLLNATVHCTDDTDHFWNGGVVTVEATCVTEGERYYECPCGAVMTMRTGLDPENHVNTVLTPAVPSTCTEQGYTSGKFCSDCGAYVYGHTQVPLADHDWGDWAPLDDDSHTRVCANDASHTETEPHAWDDGVVIAPATCTEDGEIAYTCAVCGGTKTEPVEKLQHNWGDWTPLDADSHTRVCANDASHTETAPHNDADNDGVCDDCGADVLTPETPDADDGICKYCGQRHKGIRGFFIEYLHDILYLIRVFTRAMLAA